MTHRERRQIAAGDLTRAFLPAAAWASLAAATLAADATMEPRTLGAPVNPSPRYQARYDASVPAAAPVGEGAAGSQGYDSLSGAPDSAGNPLPASSPAGAAYGPGATGGTAIEPWPEESRAPAMRAYPKPREPGASAPPAPPQESSGAANAHHNDSMAPAANVALGQPGDSNALSLPPPREKTGGKREAGFYQTPSIATLLGSLGVVVGLFLSAAWLLRKALPKGASLLPREAVEVLGRTPLAGRQQAHLLRVGNKILLVAITPAGAETLTEITEPEEVDRLAGICYQGRAHSASSSFRTLLGNFSYEPRSGSRRRGRRDDELDFSLLAGEAPKYD